MHTSPRTTRLLSATMATIGALALVGTSFVGTAGATGKGHGQAKKDDRAAASQQHAKGDRDGDADRDAGTAYTEDNDTNDGGTKNNVADSGDNKHPSGKDRSVEHGKSGNQGKAESDPDDDGRGPDRSNGGPDKPNGSGGVDKADQDGNNGCGNDDDFEDDNEGWCGAKPKQAKVEKDHGKPATTTPTTAKPKGPKDNGKPATGNPGNGKPATGNPGNGTATITVVADCYSVSVTSSKDISNVEVFFQDGTKVKFDGLTGHQWSKTFTKAVASATAKSATTRTTDAAGSCTTPAPETCPAGMVDTNGSAAGGCVTPAASDDCPAGMVDTNGSAAGGCVAPSTADGTCPVGMVDTNGTEAGGCVAPGTDSTPCPVGMVDTNGSAAGGCVAPEVLGAGATAECPVPSFGTVMPAGCDVPMGAPTPVDGEVLSAGATATAEPTAPAAIRNVSARSAAPAGLLGGVSGALAFTGLNALTLLVAALLAIAIGWALLRADRRRSEA